MKKRANLSIRLLFILVNLVFITLAGSRTQAKEHETRFLDDGILPSGELRDSFFQDNGPGGHSDSDIPPLIGGTITDPPTFTIPPLTTGDGAGTAFQSAPDAPIINVWYGDSQKFGHKGDPQKWVNILGNVTPANLASLTYSINSGPFLPLNIGPDSRRLAQAGDFNIELDYTDLALGANQVLIKAVDSDGATTNATVTVDYLGGGLTWTTPDTFTFDWATATKIDDLVQVVDGHWNLQNNGTLRTRTDSLGYDRLVAIGDLSWRDYTVTVPITFFSIDPKGYTGNSNGPGVGILTRWGGHYLDPANNAVPFAGWRERMSAIAWYRWRYRQGIYTESLQLVRYPGWDSRTVVTGRTLELNTTYNFKISVQSTGLADPPTTYRVKVWEASTPEPAGWDIEASGFAGEPRNGSILLVAHHVDAEFGKVTVDLASTQPAPKLTVNTTGSGTGAVNISPKTSNNTYRFGEDVKLTAQADNGSTFDTWQGSLTGSVNPGYLEMFSDKSVTAVFSNPNALVPASDNFSDCTLSSRWSFVNPLGDSTLTMTGTGLQVNVPAGTRHDIWPNNRNAPRILQSMNDEDFEIDLKFDSSLNGQNQFQGLLVEGNNNSFLRYAFQHDGNTYRIMAFTSLNNNTPINRFNQAISISPPMYLRTNRTGDSWTLSYSTDGENWNLAGQFDFDLAATSVGVFFGNSGQNPGFTGVVDYFYNTADPAQPQDSNRTLDITQAGSGTGTVQRTPEKNNYDCAETVTLEAIPAAGSRFVSWGGDLSGTTNPTTVVMDTSKQVVANFALDNAFTVDVTVNGNGTVTKAPDKPVYNSGESVTLTAIPANGQMFTGWSGDLSGTTNPVTITITGDRTITANFGPAIYTLLVTTEGQGTVQVNPPGDQFEAGTEISLTAIPAPNYTFVGWSGDIQGNTNPFTLLMNGNKTVKAIFTNGSPPGSTLYLPTIIK